MSYGSYGFHNMSVSDMKTVRHPTSSLLVIDSEDRNVASSVDVSSSNPVEFQAWNNFQIQTPDRLATGGINTIALESIRFPWYIPPITVQNDAMNIIVGDTTVYVDLGVDGAVFTTPKEVEEKINADLVDAGVGGLEVTWVPEDQRFVWTAVGLTGVPIRFQAVNNALAGVSVPLTNQQFVTMPSLAKTMGFNLASLSITYTPDDDPYNFSPCSGTDFLYTHYVDIVSTRLLQYRSMMDGASKNANKKALIARIYCANETSMNSYDASGNIITQGSQPFIIHRKIRDKIIKWNSEATVDYLDFQVFDEYGRLVALPDKYLNSPNPNVSTYPSFQMTFALSE
tara:strand:+ start:1336 stop:2358 length:1023 start_codon:yes stop_codon:yes gene_type:complete